MVTLTVVLFVFSLCLASPIFFPPPPVYFLAMMRFIDAARRFGKLDLVPPMLAQAEAHSSKAKYDPGYYYCKGLYEWYSGEIPQALFYPLIVFGINYHPWRGRQ